MAECKFTIPFFGTLMISSLKILAKRIEINKSGSKALTSFIKSEPLTLEHFAISKV